MRYATGWRMFVDDKPWSGLRRLFITHRDVKGATHVVTNFTAETFPLGQSFDTAVLDETLEDRADNLGDVTGFLQAALDAAWELGLRPTGFSDHTNELTATRAHLEDMRRLALKGTEPTKEKQK